MSNKVITTWRPDTCGCELNYSWDRTSSEDDRVHTADSFKPCDAHKHHTDKHKHFAAVLEENQRKNKVVNLLADKMGVHPGEFMFVLDKQRVLRVTHRGLDNNTISAVQTEIDNTHGKGKVVLSIHG